MRDGYGTVALPFGLILVGEAVDHPPFGVRYAKIINPKPITHNWVWRGLNSSTFETCLGLPFNTSRYQCMLGQGIQLLHWGHVAQLQTQ